MRSALPPSALPWKRRLRSMHGGRLASTNFRGDCMTHDCHPIATIATIDLYTLPALLTPLPRQAKAAPGESGGGRASRTCERATG